MSESKIPRSEQETVITWDKEQHKWFLYSDDPVHIRKWRKRLSNVRREEFYEDGTPKCVDGEIDGSVSVHGKRKISDEQKAKFSQRMHKAHQNQI